MAVGPLNSIWRKFPVKRSFKNIKFNCGLADLQIVKNCHFLSVGTFWQLTKITTPKEYSKEPPYKHSEELNKNIIILLVSSVPEQQLPTVQWECQEVPDSGEKGVRAVFPIIFDPSGATSFRTFYQFLCRNGGQLINTVMEKTILKSNRFFLCIGMSQARDMSLK